MQKHHREEGEEIAGSQTGLPGRKEIGIERGDERELAHEQHEFGGAEAVLEYEHEAIGSDQHPGDHWRVAGRDSIPDRNHLRLFGPGYHIAAARPARSRQDEGLVNRAWAPCRNNDGRQGGDNN